MFRLVARPSGGDRQPLRQELLQDVGSDDWCALLAAVGDRLRQIGTPHPETADTRADVHSCAAALERLRRALPHELDRRRQLRRPALGRTLTGAAVLCLDLDGCRTVNRLHGRATGDVLLRIVGARLALRVRADDIVERLDGEAFCVRLAVAPEQVHLEQLAGRLLAAVSAPVRIGVVDLGLRPSIGIAVGPADGSTAEELLACARAVLQRQRAAAGRNSSRTSGRPAPTP